MVWYYNSKVGETYFMQVDSHLHIYEHWVELHGNEWRRAKSYPKGIWPVIIPDSMRRMGGYWSDRRLPGRVWVRLSTWEFLSSDVESQIIRINTGVVSCCYDFVWHWVGRVAFNPFRRNVILTLNCSKFVIISRDIMGPRNVQHKYPSLQPDSFLCRLGFWSMFPLTHTCIGKSLVHIKQLK